MYQRRVFIIGISTTILNVVAILSLLYPGQTLVLGNDTARHYGDALGFIYNDYIRSPYPGFWGCLAIIYNLAGCPLITSLMSALVFFNIILTLAFFTFAFELLEDVNKALVATYLLMFGGGLGWLYALRVVREYPQWVGILWTNRGIVNIDVGYGLGTSLWFWYRPIVIGLTILFILLKSIIIQFSVEG